MLKHLSDLVKLQKIDTKLLEINDKKGDLPQKVKSLKEELAILKNKLERDKERLKEIAIEKHECNNDILSFKAQLEKYQDQLYLVTSNKEYDALTSEIDVLKQNIDKAEYTILSLDEQDVELSEAVKGNEISVIENEKELSVKDKQLQKKNIESKNIQDKLLVAKEKFLNHIPNRFLREYKRIFKARDGLAIVPILQLYDEKVDKKGNVEYIPAQVSCGGCHKIVPPQKVMVIRSGTKLLRCEFCGRVLCWDPEVSESKYNTLDDDII